MTQFRFRFDTILAHKLRQENSAYEQLAAQQRRVQRVEAERRRLQREIDALQHNMRQQRSGPELITRLLLGDGRLARLYERLEEQNIIVQKAVEQRDVQRERLVEAMKERKVFEQLKEKHVQRWKQENDRREQRHLDEIAQRLTVQNTAGFTVEEGS